jgi:hypothetical protein
VAENRLGCENRNRLSGYSKYGDELSYQSVTKSILFLRAPWYSLERNFGTSSFTELRTLFSG